MSSANEPYQAVAYPAPVHDAGPDSDYLLHPSGRGLLQSVDTSALRYWHRRVCTQVTAERAEIILAVVCLLALPGMIGGNGFFVGVLATAALWWLGRRLLRAADSATGSVVLRVLLWAIGVGLVWTLVTSGVVMSVFPIVLALLTYIARRRARLQSHVKAAGEPQRSACSITAAHQRIWGNAPAEGSPDDNLGSSSSEPGGAALRAALEDLTERFPHVRVFHGVLSSPGEDAAAIDHAVLIGTDLFLIDSQTCAPGNYQWGQGGLILGNGSPVLGGVAPVSLAIDQWKDHSSRVLGVEATIQGRVALVAPDGTPGGHVIDEDGSQSATRLTDIGTLTRELDAQASAARRIVDRYAMSMVIDQLR